MKQSELDTILQDFEDNMFDIAELGNTTQFIHEKKLVYEQAQQALNLYIEGKEKAARLEELENLHLHNNELHTFLTHQPDTSKGLLSTPVTERIKELEK